MELQETSMTRICEPRTRCYRSAVRSLGPWASMAVIQPEGQLTWGGAVLPQIQTLSPRIRKAHGGHWWWWPLRDPQHRGWVERWHDEVKFRCCYLLVMCYLLFPSFLRS